MMNKSSHIKNKKVTSALSPPDFYLPSPRGNHFDHFPENYYSHTGMYLCVCACAHSFNGSVVLHYIDGSNFF